MSLLNELKETKVIAIIRGLPVAEMESVVQALYEGGIRFAEITMNTEGAAKSIARVRKVFPNVRIGAGTILNVQMAEEAMEAGAEYLITPNVKKEVIEYANKRQISIWPGAFTPSEVVDAWDYGAEAVKLFPSARLGVEYIRDLAAPLGHIPFIAVGGVNESNLTSVLEAGCCAVGLGQHLIGKAPFDEKNLEGIRRRAELLLKLAR